MEVHMRKFDGNDLAVATCKLEGMVDEQSIAQVKEVQRCTADALIHHTNGDVAEAAAIFVEHYLAPASDRFERKKHN
jgi:hypothetical protein